jgi:hypothetical protein
VCENQRFNNSKNVLSQLILLERRNDQANFEMGNHLAWFGCAGVVSLFLFGDLVQAGGTNSNVQTNLLSNTRSTMKRCVSLYSELHRDVHSTQASDLAYSPAHSQLFRYQDLYNDNMSEQQTSSNIPPEGQNLRLRKAGWQSDVYTRLQTELFPQIRF